MAGSLEKGKIIWAKFGPRGGFKERPAVVMSFAADIARSGRLYVVVGSTQSLDPTIEVALPFGRAGRRHPLTKLKNATNIICDWIEEIKVSDVLKIGGSVPPTIMVEILRKLRTS